MKTINDISEELKNMGSSLAEIRKTTPYSIPDHFFETFPEIIRTSIDELNKEVVPTWTKSMPYNTPDKYFEALTEKIIDTVTSEVITRDFPNIIPFSAPVRYFEDLPQQILMAAKGADATKQSPRIIPIIKHVRVLQPIKWAIAALFIIGIGFGSYKIYLKEETNKSEQILASVSGNEIQDYLHSTYRLDVDRIVSNNNEISNIQVDNKDIIQYLNETGWDATE